MARNQMGEVPPLELVPVPVAGGAGAAVGVGVGVGGGGAAATLTVPTMPCGAWSRQMYWNEPVAVNVSW
jgi:hypothetical protein